jgi:N-methylhydantoinase A/oxoprolinase/acetone carboxylase beta subunit
MATVTDADLVLGRIPADATFPGLGTLDRDASLAALRSAGVDAEGVVAVVDAQMERALRTVSVERGVDPAELALVAFGGAGPLHACALAQAVGIPTVIVPAAAGVLSAVGLLSSPRRRELVRSWPTPADHAGLERALEELVADASDAVRSSTGLAADELEVRTAVDCRYRGQSHELRVASVADFAAAHRARNGYVLDGVAIEVTALRAVAEAPAPATIEQVLGASDSGDVQPATGPTVVARADCTIWVPEGWHGRPGPLGSMLLEQVGP